MAIDKEALIPAFYGGRGTAATTFMPETSQWADAVEAGVTPVEFDAEGARAAARAMPASPRTTRRRSTSGIRPR